MVSLSAAEELRTAAALMRDRARNATPGPWETDSDDCCVGSAPMNRPGDDYWVLMRPGATRGDLAHIASWHPAVALAVADWLEAEASAADREYEGDPTYFLPSVTVARTYLGTQP